MMKMLTKKRNKKGFTLIELVVVIAILGILAAIAIPRFGLMQKRAAYDADKTSIETISTAAQLYATDKNDFSDITVGTLQTDAGTIDDPIQWKSEGLKAKSATDITGLEIKFKDNGEPDVSSLTTILATRP